jgi:hypothetical protein
MKKTTALSILAVVLALAHPCCEVVQYNDYIHSDRRINLTVRTKRREPTMKYPIGPFYCFH